MIKPGFRERFAEQHAMGIRTVMITGDNPLTAAAIAAEAGVDDFLAEATPEMKLDYIRREQAGGRLVAMCGDGSNDAPALAQADVGGDELRNPGGEGGREPDRPRQRPDQADRGGDGGQAVADLARGVDHVHYPLAMTGIAQGIAPASANGSLIERDGKTIGSALIAQGFAGAGYLHPRPSAADHGAMPSGTSNLGPTSTELAAAAAGRRAAWQAADGGTAPVDAGTSSGSGLDPHVSPGNARGQAARIAAARGVPVAEVLRIIRDHAETRWLGLHGEPRVNVLLVNLALDAALPLPPADGD